MTVFLYAADALDHIQRITYTYDTIGNRQSINSLFVEKLEEIQQLSIKRAETMNQFLTLANDTLIPIVYVGTYKALNRIFGYDFRMTRRLGEQIEVKRFEKDYLWDDLLYELWDLQWLKEYIPLTKELNDAFYRETAGIIDRVITLYELLQMEAIHENKETVSDFTPAFKKKVSETYFPTTRKIINSLSEGNINNSEHWDDLYNREEERQLIKDLNNDIAQRKARELLTNQERKKEKFVANEYRNRVIENIQRVFGDTYDMAAIIKAYEYIVKKYPSMLQEYKETQINKSVVDILLHPDKMRKKGKGENVVDNYQLTRLDNLI